MLTPRALLLDVLFRAAKNGYLPLVRLLLRLQPGLATARSRTHDTALHFAAIHPEDDVIKLLLAAGADPNVAETQCGFTPLHYHIVGGSYYDVRALIDAGANVRAALWDGITPLHRISHRPFRLTEALPDDVLVLLLKRGADPNAADSKGYTPLHLAAKAGSEAVVILLEYGADPNARNSEGRTPLHLAAVEGCWGAAERLLAGNADPNAQNERGNTPLHLASVNIRPRTVVTLLGRGANARLRNVAGYTPRDLAERDLPPETFRSRPRTEEDIPLIWTEAQRDEIVARLREHDS